MIALANNKLVKLIFFGNYFYGLCAIGLSLEATLQQRLPLNGFLYYVFIFLAVIVFYSKAYLITETSENSINQRSAWYLRNSSKIKMSLAFFLALLVIMTLIFVINNQEAFIKLGFSEYFLISIFPIVSTMYYGINYKSLAKYNLRNVGWLKPFIIGFSWAGLVTLYPRLFYCLDHEIPYTFTLISGLLFLKNFMYITVLCIMFDIKDYAMDYNQKLKTFVVNVGLRKTIFFIIIPLSLLGLFSFLVYAFIQHFSFFKILLNTIPFICIITVAYSLHNRRSILYYLIIIDGLMLLKAMCGINAMIFF